MSPRYAGPLLLCSCLSASAAQWSFQVTLDGKPIGRHVFTVSEDRSSVSSQADYQVKLLGLTVYRYSHRSQESWAGGCLRSIAAATDDNGQRTEVQGQAGGAGLRWEVRRDTAVAAQSNAACTLPFAYWNPAIFEADHLLDPGSGRLVEVRVQPLAEATVEVRGQPARVHGWRLFGLDHPIDVWYAGAQWVGLDTIVDGHRTLRYRLP